MPQDEYYTVEYRLELEGGTSTTYQVEIHKNTMVSRLTAAEPLPDWTRLDQGKCSQCPLVGSEHCPIAVRLVKPMQQFKDLISHAPAITTVVTPERSYKKYGDIQDALRSLFGLIMATSGCPLMQPFKFMARYHLPFSTLEETICRITSTYLMRQLLDNLDKKNLSIDFSEIETLYNTMESLNEGLAERLRKAFKNSGDGTMNAIIILTTYSSLIPIIIRNELKKLHPLFE